MGGLRRKHPVGSEVEGEVKNKTEFGLFIGLENDVDGMVHLSDLDWNRPGEQVIDDFKKGDMVRAQVLDVDVEKERISLGIKQLGGDPFAEAGELKKGQIVTCEVLEVKDGGIEVKIVDTDLSTFIKRNELARDRADQRPERFAAGEKIDARVTQFDRKARRVTLSIKALEVAEEKEAIAQYGSSRFGCFARRHPRRRPEQGQDRQEVSLGSRLRTRFRRLSEQVTGPRERSCGPSSSDRDALCLARRKMLGAASPALRPPLLRKC